MTCYSHIGNHRHRLAINVVDTRQRSVYFDLTSAEGVDVTVLVNCLGEKASANDSALKRTERLDNCHVEQAILQTGMWSNKSVVAILRGISTSDDKDILVDKASVNLDTAVDWLIAHINLKSRLYIVEGAAFCALGISVGDIGIKAHTGCANESIVVQ